MTEGPASSDPARYLESNRAVAVRVKSLSDLAKIATLGAARMFILPIYKFREGGKTVFMVQTVFKDYYKLYGLPIIYYYVGDEEASGDHKYLLVKVDESGEYLELSRGTKPGWIAIPIVELTEKPPFAPSDLGQ